MKLIFCYLTLASIGLNSVELLNVTLSEANLLYHFPDFTYDQFNYILPWRVLDYYHRAEKFKQLFNDIRADYTCLCEWNGNPLSSHFIEKDEGSMKLKLKSSIDSLTTEILKLDATTQTEVNKHLNGLDKTNFDMKINKDKILNAIQYLQNQKDHDKTAIKNVLDQLDDALTRNAALDLRKGLFFFKDNFVTRVLPKKTGYFLKDGVVQKDKKCTPKPYKATDNVQSVFMAYNPNVFKEVDGEDFVEVADYEEEGKPEKGCKSQTFLAKILLHVATKRHFLMICMHQKSKPAGIFDRMSLGGLVRSYIDKVKAKKAYEDIVVNISGDLNSEIDEVSLSFNFKITRVDPVERKYPFEPSSAKEVFYPSRFVEYLEEYKKTTQTQMTAAFTSATEPKECQADFSASITKTIGVLNSYITKAKIQNDSPLLLDFLETNNFKTENKIRFKEINFEPEKHDTSHGSDPAEKSYLQALEELKKNANFGKYHQERLASVVKKPKEEKAKADGAPDCKKEFEKKYEGHVKGLNKVRREDFISYVDTFASLERLFEKGIHDKTVDRTKDFHGLNVTSQAPKDILYSMVKPLFHAEKIDFILISNYEWIKLVSFRSNTDYQRMIERGIPNDELPVDHASSIVVIDVQPKTINREINVANIIL